MTKSDKIQLGEQARKIKENPAWHAITNTMMNGLQQSWSECNDPVVREDIWHRQNALHDLIGDIDAAIMNGDIAATTP